VQQDSGDKKVLQRLKLRAGIATGISIALAVCVIGMFAIQMTTGSVNILNYENEIINKYEKWEQELSEREAAVRELELENGISGQGEDRED
jgi:biopolymer transport protein ExbB/TolQ